MNNTADLVRVTDAYMAVRQTNSLPNRAQLDRFIKREKIEVVSRFKFGRGMTELMKQSQLDELLARQAEIAKLTAAKTAMPSEPVAPVDIHLGALEAKIDRLETKIAGLTDAMNVFVKAANLQADNLSKYHEEVARLVKQLT